MVGVWVSCRGPNSLIQEHEATVVTTGAVGRIRSCSQASTTISNLIFNVRWPVMGDDVAIAIECPAARAEERVLNLVMRLLPYGNAAAGRIGHPDPLLPDSEGAVSDRIVSDETIARSEYPSGSETCILVRSVIVDIC